MFWMMIRKASMHVSVYLFRTPQWNWDRRRGPQIRAIRNWHLLAIHGTSDWLERQVFPADDNRCRKSSESKDRLCCDRNQTQDGYFTLW